MWSDKREIDRERNDSLLVSLFVWMGVRVWQVSLRVGLAGRCLSERGIRENREMNCLSSEEVASDSGSVERCFERERTILLYVLLKVQRQRQTHYVS